MYGICWSHCECSTFLHNSLVPMIETQRRCSSFCHRLCPCRLSLSPAVTAPPGRQGIALELCHDLQPHHCLEPSRICLVSEITGSKKSVNMSQLTRKCCRAKTGMRASAQSVNALNNMRALTCLIYTPPLRPWSTRSNHGYGLPKLRRCCTYVSVSVRVFRSGDFENVFFLLFPAF